MIVCLLLTDRVILFKTPSTLNYNGFGTGQTGEHLQLRILYPKWSMHLECKKGKFLIS